MHGQKRRMVFGSGQSDVHEREHQPCERHSGHGSPVAFRGDGDAARPDRKPNSVVGNRETAYLSPDAQNRAASELEAARFRPGSTPHSPGFGGTTGFVWNSRLGKAG